MTTMNEESLVSKQAAEIRAANPDFARWAAGYGVVSHSDRTQLRISTLIDRLVTQGLWENTAAALRVLSATDKLANAGMWLVVHMTYASRVRLDGSEVNAEDFKKEPEGHTGGSLNMVPAYAGYLAANSLTKKTRAWLMGQGHCVAAIDSLNLLLGNVSAAHASRYNLSDDGLSRYVKDFYSYEIKPDGSPLSPLGSHVNPFTAGGLLEGGYLGFAEIQYVHMPLPSEELVVFLSDGAFEEQRGSDWTPRWWRAKDSGMVMPVMIANGRRIDQRTTVAQQGGVDWFRKHLQLNGFTPIDVDGKDPADFVWAILEMERMLQEFAAADVKGELQYPAALGYAIAETIKGFGFPGAGTNRAHNLPLEGNPHTDSTARAEFNRGAKALWVSPSELTSAIDVINNHNNQRPRERDNPLANRNIPPLTFPSPHWKQVDINSRSIPMQAVDEYFCEILKSNPALRPRVGNPDELQSNKMNKTLQYLQHRVTAPEPGIWEDVHGKIITALNEEAVVCAALGNKGGINMVVSYEAFAVKMLGALRQELIFSRHQLEANQKVGWLSVPIFLTSHVWENGKNEISHQDPTLAEALLNEMSDVSRVVFPADWNMTLAVLQEVYSTRGQVWAVVAPKRVIPERFSKAQALQIVKDSGLRIRGTATSDVQLVAIGSYQLEEIEKAAQRLEENGVTTSIVYLLEPGRFRIPRDKTEEKFVLSKKAREELFPQQKQIRVILSHTRAEPIIGTLRSVDQGPEHTKFLGFCNRGGTLDVFGMLFTNSCTWAHVIRAAAEGLGKNINELLSNDEVSALLGDGNPQQLK